MHTTPEERLGLVQANLQLLAISADEVNRKLDSNTATIRALETRISQLETKVADHGADSKELLELFRFNRRLRRLILGLVGGAAVFLTVATQGHHLAQELKDFFR